ncbi:MAG: photosystem II protein Psb27 [Synechococcales bacterium]|nr:photosystem II protein Psb27 [Synechococcales bacterium]
MKRYLSRLWAIVLVMVMSWIGLPGIAAADSLTGTYRDDALTVITVMRQAMNAEKDDPNRAALTTEARQKINDFAARYRRRSSVLKLNSYTTIRTALNSLAGHYSSYPNRPVPDKMKKRLEDEFRQVEIALNRGA